MGRGRPKVEIDQKLFKKLCSMFCTKEEIAGVFECSEDTIERWCKRTYHMNFADVFKKECAHGKISLRRNQFKLSEKSAAMAIFLGKQYLGQKDQQDVQISRSDDDTIKEMYEYFKQRASSETNL